MVGTTYVQMFLIEDLDKCRTKCGISSEQHIIINPIPMLTRGIIRQVQFSKFYYTSLYAMHDAQEHS